MTVSDVMKVVEGIAPLRLQEEYDNAGLQVGLPASPVDKVLVCLDITEDVIREAVSRGCQMVVSHHPLIFRPLRQVCGVTLPQRCVALALREGVTLYSAHTNLDNAEGGVNFEIASRLGLSNVAFLQPRPGGEGGSGIIGELETPREPQAFMDTLKSVFGVECLMHSSTERRLISKVAVCGGAGAFLIPDAQAAGADCFVTGEIHYHDFSGNEGMLLCALGHYESEQYTSDLLVRMLRAAGVDAILARSVTNPVLYR